MKITTSTNKLNPLHADFDPQLSALAGSLVTGLGILPIVSGDKTCYEMPDNLIDLNTADMLHSKGVEITGMPLWIKLTSKTTKNKFGVKNEEGVLLTWEEWKLDNHTFYEVDGNTYIGTNAHTNEYMDFADLQGVRELLVTANELPKNNIEE
jgi:hypothetical protein